MSQSSDKSLTPAHQAAGHSLEAFFEISSDGLVIVGNDGKIRRVNSVACATFGYSESELLNEPLDVLLPDGVRAYHSSILSNYFKAPYQRRLGDRFEGRRKDGSLFSMSIGLGHFTVDGEQFALASLTDLSERKRYRAIERNHSKALGELVEGQPLSAILSTITLGVEELEPEWKVSVLLSDDSATTLNVGAAPSLPQFYNEAVDGLRIGVGQGSCGTAASTLQTVIVEDIQTHPYWVNFRDIAGQANLRSCWSRPVVDAHGKLLGTFAIYNDKVTHPTDEDLYVLENAASLTAIAVERSKYEGHLKHLANYDPVTQLPNRYMLEEYLEGQLTSAADSSDELALLFIDLDKFKRINDKLGHVAGDRLLREVARRFNRCVTDEAFLARWGGDEFIVVTPVKSIEEVTKLAQAFSDALRHPFTVTESQYYLSMSTGISLYPQDSNDSEGLLRCADTAMFEAKRAGSNIFCFFQRSMGDGVARFVSIENALRASLINGGTGMSLALQPQFNLDGDRMTGLEALVRWNEPKLAAELEQSWGSLISPAEFVAVAEQSGLINELGNWVLEQALKTYAQLAATAGLSVPMAVNFSAIQLQDPDLADRVSHLCHRYKVPASAVKIEVTETAVFSDEANALELLMQLKTLGHPVSLDDFGTGFASLGYLQKLQPDEIKIDRIFINGLPDNADSRNIIQFTTQLAQTMGSRLIAEGVETEAQLESLRSIGEMNVQGYIYSKPMTPAQLTSLLLTGEEPKYNE